MKKRYAIAVVMLMLILLLSVTKSAGEKPMVVSPPFPAVPTIVTLGHRVLELKVQEQKPVEKPAKPEHEVAVTSIEEPTHQDKHSYSDDDLYWLSRIVSAEARGEPSEGQIAVANVVLNRVASNEFPDTIKGVIFDKGQFSPVSNGSLYKKPTKEAIESAKKALEGENAVGNGVLYFFEAKTATAKWSKKRKVAERIGHHTFTY